MAQSLRRKRDDVRRFQEWTNGLRCMGPVTLALLVANFVGQFLPVLGCWKHRTCWRAHIPTLHMIRKSHYFCRPEAGSATGRGSGCAFRLTMGWNPVVHRWYSNPWNHLPALNAVFSALVGPRFNRKPSPSCREVLQIECVSLGFFELIPGKRFQKQWIWARVGSTSPKRLPRQVVFVGIAWVNFCSPDITDQTVEASRGGGVRGTATLDTWNFHHIIAMYSWKCVIL